MNKIFGVDLDNTIISYDTVLYRLASARGLIDNETPKHKTIIRNRIRKLPGGEIEWQKLQAAVYGPGMDGAELIDGVREFLIGCRGGRIPVFIVSHKTEYANHDVSNTNLRTAAMCWLEKSGLIDYQRYGLTHDRIFFESTRMEKIQRIINLNCTIFIDDLTETFAEERFPDGVKKILYSKVLAEGQKTAEGATVCNSWRTISRILLSPKKP